MKAIKNSLRSESPMMWVSWGELIGMSIATILMFGGAISLIASVCQLTVSTTPTMFVWAVLLIGVGTVVMLITQGLTHK